MTTDARTLRWGILGAGRIAGIFAQGLQDSQRGKLVAIGSRSVSKAREFAATHGATNAWGSYEEALADREVDAFYLATPHPEHLQWGIAILQAGKHLLCEKPLCLNAGDAEKLITAARKHERLLSEAFMYRTHPQTRKVVSLIQEGVIGRVQLIQAAFSYNSPFSPESRVWNNDLGGGGILDVGCYPISFARLIAGAANGQPFADPEKVSGHAILHPETGVDAQAVATLQFAGDILAQVSTGVAVTQENSARIYGEKGSIYIPAPWTYVNQGKGPYSFTLHLHNKEPETITIDNTQSVYAREADAFAEALFSGKSETAFMSHADTLGNLRALDRWRAACGVVYNCEK